MKTKDLHHNYNVIRDNYLTDIDLSGGLLIEHEKTNNGNRPKKSNRHKREKQ